MFDNQSTMTKNGNQYGINVKLAWLDPPRIHTEWIDLGDCSEADAQEAFEAVKQMLEAQFGQ
jgi:hypothetical protein